MNTKIKTRSRTLRSQRVKVRKNASIAPALLVVCMVICMSLFYVWSRIETLRINYSVTELNERLHQQQNLNEELTGMVAQLKNPERIAMIAEKELGLAFPKPSQVWPIGSRTEESSLKVARP